MIDFYKKYSVVSIDDKSEFLISAFHLLLGAAIYFNHTIAVLYCWSLFLIGSLYIIGNKDKNFQVLSASAYLVGSEVFLRMTKATPTYEFIRYGLLFFLGLGIFYNGFDSKSKWYFIYILALIPGVILGFSVLENPIYSKIIFDFIGPLLLTLASVYCFGKKISFQDLSRVLCFLKWPVFACLGYLFVFNINLNYLYFNTESNFLVTGNYGPNQVATVFGFVAFSLFVRLIIRPLKSWYAFFDVIILAYSMYICLLTFSRGGTIVCLIICSVFIVQVYYNHSYLFNQPLVKLKFMVLFFLGILIIATVAVKTDGLILKRYANQFSNGSQRNESKFARKKLVAYELDLFLKHPVLGAGVGFGKQNSVRVFGKKISTHNELTRSMAEHGVFGILAILIVLLTPLYFYQQTSNNVYFWCFYLFWLLTILHSGLRISIPAFVYSLSLLSVDDKS